MSHLNGEKNFFLIQTESVLRGSEHIFQIFAGRFLCHPTAETKKVRYAILGRMQELRSTGYLEESADIYC